MLRYLYVDFNNEVWGIGGQSWDFEGKTFYGKAADIRALAALAAASGRVVDCVTVSDNQTVDCVTVSDNQTVDGRLDFITAKLTEQEEEEEEEDPVESGHGAYALSFDVDPLTLDGANPFFATVADYTEMIGHVNKR